MAEATLVAHCGARKVSFEELAAMPLPPSLGTRHKPIAHHELVTVLQKQVESRGYLVKRAEYAIQTEGQKLFGVFDLQNGKVEQDRGYAVGFRTANDQTFALRIVAGARVFVCDNLALSGSDIVLNRKHTTGLSLNMEIGLSVQRLFAQYATMDSAIARMQRLELAEEHAKALIYDAFVDGESDIPTRLLSHVNHWYFDRENDAAPDCEPRTLWGLHNAFTRSIKVLNSPTRQFEVTQAVGKYLGLVTA